ncbi:MAG: hypothetical protein BBJ57_11520 [Desulfobacterales bacterium PC51MH44]|nr:MAG: hypothetical protein BBJ57_11520 [Desulfobacterales bacterium PC51MH44]
MPVGLQKSDIWSSHQGYLGHRLAKDWTDGCFRLRPSGENYRAGFGNFETAQLEKKYPCSDCTSQRKKEDIMGEEVQSKKTDLQNEFEAAVEKGDSGGIAATLRKIFINALELKITTTVTKGSTEQISTTINLLEGDITTTMHKNFVPDLQNVADFHKEQVVKAEQIIERNINTLKNLADALMELR